MRKRTLHGPHIAVPPEAAGLRTSARRWCRGCWEDLEETAAGEEAVCVEYARGRSNLWAWPHDLEDLALGHVLLDCAPFAVPATPDDANADVAALDNAACPVPLPAGTVEYAAPRLPAPAGVHCLRVSFGAATAAVHSLNPAAEPQCKAAVLLEEMRGFFSGAGHWDGTGSFHRAGLFCPAHGGVLRTAEDIGRHNCLDRLAGFCARQGLNPAEYILFISARITGSLYAKARRAGFVFMVSRGAVTSAALCLGREQGVSLVGFCRPAEERLTVFCDAAGRVGA